MLIKKDFGSRVFYVKPEDEARFVEAVSMQSGGDRYYKMVDIATVVVDTPSSSIIKSPDKIVAIVDSYYI
jgi:hypothetical protein